LCIKQKIFVSSKELVIFLFVEYNEPQELSSEYRQMKSAGDRMALSILPKKRRLQDSHGKGPQIDGILEKPILLWGPKVQNANQR